MSDWIKVPVDHETREQIRVLKDKGYLVLHRDAVRTVAARVSMDKDHLLRGNFPASDVVRRELARSLAEEVSKQPDFAISETQRGVVRIEYEARIDFIGAKIGPEDNDYPLYLNGGRP